MAARDYDEACLELREAERNFKRLCDEFKTLDESADPNLGRSDLSRCITSARAEVERSKKSVALMRTEMRTDSPADAQYVIRCTAIVGPDASRDTFTTGTKITVRATEEEVNSAVLESVRLKWVTATGIQWVAEWVVVPSNLTAGLRYNIWAHAYGNVLPRATFGIFVDSIESLPISE